MNRLKWETLKILIFFDDEDTRYSDCGAKMGQYHHVGCDCEICPVCGGQLIGCDCEHDE